MAGDKFLRTEESLINSYREFLDGGYLPGAKVESLGMLLTGLYKLGLEEGSKGFPVVGTGLVSTIARVTEEYLSKKVS